jgi:hypothetical protein
VSSDPLLLAVDAAAASGVEIAKSSLLGLQGVTKVTAIVADEQPPTQRSSPGRPASPQPEAILEDDELTGYYFITKTSISF